MFTLQFFIVDEICLKQVHGCVVAPQDDGGKLKWGTFQMNSKNGSAAEKRNQTAKYETRSVGTCGGVKPARPSRRNAARTSGSTQCLGEGEKCRGGRGFVSHGSFSTNVRDAEKKPVFVKETRKGHFSAVSCKKAG